ncbi:MAG TPA: ribosome biogenesis GTPase Der [Terriglobales bacterium]|nr:ribosome biogenesis GTPase Der [Terriglobales bacterium]
MAETANPAKLPTLVIVGRPNVGKSTLFNRLVGRRRAIVGDEPGITRDRLYGFAHWLTRNFRVIDTGGIIPNDKELIPSEIYRQAKVGLEEADAVVMVVDGRTELAAPDMELARLLLRSGTPLFLAVNKIDTPKLEAEAENFRRLGIKNLFPISAEHGNGVAELLDAALAVMPQGTDATLSGAAGLGGPPYSPPLAEGRESDYREEEEAQALEKESTRETKIAIIGRPNVGKSTLLNALTGTARAIVSPIPGTTRDAVDEVVEHHGKTFRFIDTAGIRRKGRTELMAEKLSVIMARKHLEAADVSLLVIDATEGATALDANIGGYAHESGRSVIIVVNKWDLVVERAKQLKSEGAKKAKSEVPRRAKVMLDEAMRLADPQAYEREIRRNVKFLDYAPMIFVSATTGRNIDNLFSEIEIVASERRKRISTGEMNRFLETIDFERASVPYKSRVRIMYMTQAAVAPPTFILFTDRDVKLHFSYERFIENQIRAAFGFVGTPIWIKTRARNPKQR